MTSIYRPEIDRKPVRRRDSSADPGIILPWLIAALLLLLLPSPGRADQAGTIFLPLKINASVSFEIAGIADQALNEAAAGQGAVMAGRSDAEHYFDYDKRWPPSPETMKSFAAGRGINHIAAGSLTRFGEKISIDFIVFDLPAGSAPKYFYREIDSASELTTAIDELANDICAYTGRYFLIAGIDIQGNERIDSGAILRQVSSKVGDHYRPEKLKEDLRRIFHMGYFDDVQIDATETDDGMEVTFLVKERDVIGLVKVSGAKELEEKDVREVISITPNNIINSKELRESLAKIRKLYKDKGFFNTTATAELNNPKPGRVDVTFVIDEGSKVYIKKVGITGNKSFKTKELKKIIETSERGFLSWLTESGVLKRDSVEQDAARIAAFYHNHGFIDAKVGDPEISQKGKWIYVNFNISEGARYRVGAVDLEGELIEDKDTLLGLVKIKDEEFFSREVLHKDILRLTDFYAEKGYAFAEAAPAIRRSVDENLINLKITIKKGALVHVNRIIIKGNTRTRDKVIRREITAKEGGVFNASDLRVSQQRLRRLEYFEDIIISPEQTSGEDMMDIRIEVKEKPTGQFSIGAGYSSVDSLMFMAQISEDNFLGRGQRMALDADLSGTSARYNFSFTEPHLNDTKLLAGLDLYNWVRDYDDYTKDSTGFAFRFGYPIWKRWSMYFSYGYDDTSLTNVRDNTSQVILDSMDIKITSFIKLSLQRDSRNRIFDATKGSQHSINLEYAGGPLLGGDSSFTKMEGSTSWYFPLFWDITYHIKGTVGYVFENSGGKLPVYEKFYLGGINTIRGFDYAQISPQDPVTGERIGGTKMWLMNAEWIFPLVKEAGLKGVVFFDAGNVYSASENWDFNYIKKSVGFGFRWLSPMGPLRLEWGYNIDPVRDEDSSNWDFSVGGAF